MVEDENKPAGNSDRDKRMMGSFEGYDDKDDKDEKKANKKVPSFFDQLKDELKIEKNEKPDDKKETESSKVEELSDEENHQVIEQYVEARTEDLKEDVAEAEPDSLAEALALANAALLEKIDENGSTTEEEFDADLAATAEDLDLDMAEVEDDDTEEDDTVTTSTATATAGGGTTPPIIPPTPPTPASPSPPPGGGPGRPAVLAAPASPNILPQPVASTTESWRVRRRRAGQALLVGTVGYMLGRRRGRIKTEARLLPVQEKLEKQVKSLHDQVAEREAKIRQLVAKKVEQQPQAERPAIIEKLVTKIERQQPTPETPIEQPTRRPEALGKFAIPKTPEAAPEAVPKSVETLTVPELLTIAERIEKDGVSVKEMYEAGRLDAEGLRRVIREFLRGERLDHILAENLRHLDIMEKETIPQQKPDDGGQAQQASQPVVVPSPVSQVAPQPAQTDTPPEADEWARRRAAQKAQDQKQTAIAVSITAVVLMIIFAVLILG